MSDVGDMLHSYTESLNDYLEIKKEKYIIPFSQRNYEWRKQDVHRLFKDLVSLYDMDPNKLHMLNFFTVFRNDDGDLEIFDGQQRTITCLLILAVIGQKLYKKDNKSDGAKQIRETYFEKQDALRKKSGQKKLEFDSSEDDDFFYKITDLNFDVNAKFENVLKTDDLNRNQRNMIVNIKYINDLLDEFIDKNDTVDLSDLSVSITDKTFLVKFIADNEEIALNMFESLNNTGKSIEKYYVLKNDMVKCLGEDVVKEMWQSIDSNLSELNTNTFLISIGTMFAGKTTASKMLDHLYIKTDEANSDQMLKLLKLIKSASSKFLQICNPNQMENTNKNELMRYKDLSEKIKMFAMRQHRPMILAMLMKNKDLAEINDILHGILILTVRNFYFDGRKANTIEKVFADLANDVYMDKISTTNLKERISNLSISNEELKSAIEKKKITRNDKVAYILKEIYNNELRSNELEVGSQKNDLEHILPQKPTAEWIELFPNENEREKSIYSIGNMTLWLNSDNRSAQNAQFDVKKEKYKLSGLPENQRIAQNTQWTAKEIQLRSQQLAEKIAEVFN